MSFYYLYLSISIIRVTKLKRIMEVGYVAYTGKRNCLTNFGDSDD